MPAYLPLGCQPQLWSREVCLLTRICLMTHRALRTAGHTGKPSLQREAECGVRKTGLTQVSNLLQ